MDIKKISFIACLISLSMHGQALKNTSYKNDSGEKVLRFEAILPINQESAWQLFTIDAQLQKWIAPLAHIDLKSGGYIITQYDDHQKLSDSTAIKLPITSYIDKELLVLKVILNGNFTQSIRASNQNLQEIIQFIPLDANRTKVVSSMIGWGKGADWDKTYDFFAKGNEWTYQELLKHYKDKP